ncbi:MAG TPA: hypothetical protein VHV83_00265, partial [Armatimonadota bacterium]|nr:hypothetical protein [Armatimonadota bacterium]
RGNGFVFQEYSPDELQQAIHRAIKCFRDKQACWERAMQNAFTSDFSWEASANKYVKVYRDILKAIQDRNTAVERKIA